jgi:HK97 family phage prohead protease
MDLSKRANLRNVREVRGLMMPVADSPTGMTGADWGELVDMRADSESDPDFWIFRGEASVVDHDYTVRDMFGEFTERIAPGAFDATLKQNPDVMFNYMHDPAMTMVTTRGGGLTLSADPHLTVNAHVPKTDVDAQRVMPKVQRGDAASMSFAFRVTDQVWNEDYTDRTITGVNLSRGDVAVIVSGLGANPAAWGTVRVDTSAAQATIADFAPITDEVLRGEPLEIDPEERSAFLRELVAVQLRSRVSL